jgi:hypothetical protein
MTKVTIEARKPIATGMKVLSIGTVPFKDIVSTAKGTNFNRPEGVDMNRVNQYTKLMKEGLYEPEYYVPPVVVKMPHDTYRLISGCHRYLGADLAGSTEFYCAVVEFVETDTKCGDYWERSWQGIENKKGAREVSKNYGKPAGTVSIVRSMIEDGIITDSDECINAAIEDVGGVKSSSDRGKNFYHQIQAELGKTKGVTRLYTKKEANQAAVDFTDVDTHVLVRTMKDETGYDDDYDKRLNAATIQQLLTHQKNVTQLIHFSALNPTQILNCRNFKRVQMVHEFETYVKPYYDMFKSGELLERVNVKFLPQIEEDKMVS